MWRTHRKAFLLESIAPSQASCPHREGITSESVALHLALELLPQHSHRPGMGCRPMQLVPPRSQRDNLEEDIRRRDLTVIVFSTVFIGIVRHKTWLRTILGD